MPPFRAERAPVSRRWKLVQRSGNSERTRSHRMRCERELFRWCTTNLGAVASGTVGAAEEAMMVVVRKQVRRWEQLASVQPYVGRPEERGWGSHRRRTCTSRSPGNGMPAGGSGATWAPVNVLSPRRIQSRPPCSPSPTVCASLPRRFAERAQEHSSGGTFFTHPYTMRPSMPLIAFLPLTGAFSWAHTSLWKSASPQGSGEIEGTFDACNDVGGSPGHA